MTCKNYFISAGDICKCSTKNHGKADFQNEGEGGILVSRGRDIF